MHEDLNVYAPNSTYAQAVLAKNEEIRTLRKILVAALQKFPDSILHFSQDEIDAANERSLNFPTTRRGHSGGIAIDLIVPSVIGPVPNSHEPMHKGIVE